MKESKKLLESSRPSIYVIEGINFVLNSLYKDKKHSISEEVVKDLTYEELIGV